MNFTSLQYFLVAAQTLNFSKAAEKLFISQQALSSCINGLEKELGIKLFTRGKKLTLTYAGMRFATYASSICTLEERLREEMQHLQMQHKGKVYVTINETRASALMPVVLGKFYQRYPFVEVSLIEGDAMRVADSILTNDAHFGVGLGLAKGGIQAEKILNDKLCLMIPKNYVETAQSELRNINSFSADQSCSAFLQDLPLIMLNKTMLIRQWTDDYLALHRIQPNILFEATSVQTMFSMVHSGLGAAFCNESFFYSFQDSLERNSDQVYIYPLEDAASKELGIFFRVNCLPNDYSRYLIELIQAYYAERSVEFHNGKIAFHLKGD